MNQNNDKLLEFAKYTKQGKPLDLKYSNKKKLKKIVRLLKDEEYDDNDIQNFKNELFTYYEADERLYNSTIAEEIFNINNETSICNIQKNLFKLDENINNEIDLSDNKQKNEYKFWIKFKDQIELSILQRSKYELSTKKIISIAQEAAKTESEKVQKDITGQLISLVSIFTALSFVIFGGISALDSIITTIKESSILKITVIGLLWAVCMFLLLYIFMTFIILIINPNKKIALKKKNNKTLTPFPNYINVIFIIIFSILTIAIIGLIILSYIHPSLLYYIMNI